MYTKYLVQVEPSPGTMIGFHVVAQCHDDAIECAWWQYKDDLKKQAQLDRDLEDFDRRWREENDNMEE